MYLRGSIYRISRNRSNDAFKKRAGIKARETGNEVMAA